MNKSIFRAILMTLAVLTALPALAQEFPNKPLRIIVPYPPGGITDRIARDTAAEMQKRLKQPVFVENKSGAAGNIGFDYASKQASDGYTLVLAPASNLTVQNSLFKKLTYSIDRDFLPLSLLIRTPQVLTTHPAVPARTVKELVELSKKQGSRINYGGTIGSFIHLGSEQLRTNSGADFTFVSYQGLGPAINDLLGGQIQFMFNEVTSVMQTVATGQLRPLAVAYNTRVPWMPNVPTFAEAGYPEIEVTSWYAMVTRAGTPKPVVDLLVRTLQDIMRDAEFKKRYYDIGAFTVGSSPEELAGFIKSESEKWTRLVIQVGIEPN